MRDFIDWEVRELNELNRAVPMLMHMMHEQDPSSPQWEALWQGFALARDKLHALRTSVGAQCAPWFGAPDER